METVILVLFVGLPGLLALAALVAFLRQRSQARKFEDFA